MTQAKKITAPLDNNSVTQLKAGDSVLITGYIYTGRDAAHKRLIELIEKGHLPNQDTPVVQPVLLPPTGWIPMPPIS